MGTCVSGTKTLEGHLSAQENVMTMLKKLIKSKRGATAIEYGLIAALIAVSGITAFGAVGNGVKNTFNNAKNKL